MSTPEPVLPKSRQPVPGSLEVEAEMERRRSRSVQEIEKSISERTERLAGNIDELAGRMSPARLARASAGRVGSLFTTADGGPRLEAFGAVAGAVLVAGFMIWRGRRRR